MGYVYIIRRVGFPEQEHTGATADLRQRLEDHNTGKSAHTSKFAPWELKCYVALPDKQRAIELERYLKSHSGRAFAKKRLTRGRVGYPDCGYSSMVEQQPSKLNMRVRFPLPAPVPEARSRMTGAGIVAI